VAVHPEDERYRNLPSDTVLLPLTDRIIPIIRDAYVGMAFGTGALKVTPAHDPNDFEIGTRHNLPRPKVIDDNGLMTEEAGRFEGMDRFKCRESVVQALQDQGLLVGIEPYPHNVGHCYRCKTIVEPNLSRQWFVRAKPLAEKAIAAVQNGQTRIIPEIWAANYYDWLNNIRDWCISRQIWWGHQIPAWTCEACGKMIVSLTAPSTCDACGHPVMIQETDVLDTWFSSALWPFSTMGWPENSPLLKTFYPTSVLVTGFDILFFWVARMMMMGIHFMEDVPFKDVYVHALVRDEAGKKMSKSKGNVIDPLTVMDQYGTDSTAISPGPLTLANQWILSRSESVARSASEALEAYHFNDAAGMLYHYVWHELCDWYLETVKPALYGKEGELVLKQSRAVLWRVLKNTLISLHPFIPFVTEEIWHMLPGTEGSIMNARLPQDSDPDFGRFVNPEAEQQMAIITSIITGVRNIRGEMNLAPSLKLNALIQTEHVQITDTIHRHEDIIAHLAKLEKLSVDLPGERPKAAATAIVESAIIYVPLEGVLDLSKEIQRLEKEIEKLNGEMSGVSKKLNNEDFLSKAPADIIVKVKEKHAALSDKLQHLQINLEKIKAVI
jgi:valyl-tRNA synthetase